MSIAISFPMSVTNRTESMESLFREIRKYKPLSAEEERMCAERGKLGDKEALDMLVVHNMPFCVSVAKRFLGRGLSLEDLTQEAFVGLVEAARNFDGSMGAKFCTFAVYYICRQIRIAINEYGSIVRRSDSIVRKHTKLERIIAAFVQEYGFMPSAADLQELSGYKADTVKNAMECGYGCVSLDAPMFDEESAGFCMADCVCADDVSDADVELESQLAAVKCVLGRLPMRDMEIARMHWGLDCDVYSNKEIGERFHISGERVRQIIGSITECLRDELCGDVEFAVAG